MTRQTSNQYHRIYLASSWRNKYQPGLVMLLREWGHEVYDFRNPKPGDTGFQWSEIDPVWQDWSVVEYRKSLSHPTAEYGFKLDMEALRWADVVVLLLPSGRSAHSEAAWHRGQGKPVIIHSPVHCEPELMYKMFNAITENENELFAHLNFSLSQIDALCL